MSRLMVPQFFPQHKRKLSCANNFSIVGGALEEEALCSLHELCSGHLTINLFEKSLWN